MKTSNNLQVRHNNLKVFFEKEGINHEDVAFIIGKSLVSFENSLNGTGEDFSLYDVKRICMIYKLSADSMFVHKSIVCESFRR